MGFNSGFKRLSQVQLVKYKHSACTSSVSEILVDCTSVFL